MNTEKTETEELAQVVQRLLPPKFRPAAKASRLLENITDPEPTMTPTIQGKTAALVLLKIAAPAPGPYQDPSASTDAGDITSTLLGGIPVLGPAAAGLASGYMTPRNNTSVGAMTTAGSAFGQAAGGMGGAAIGAGLGAGGLALAKRLGFDPGISTGDAAAIGGLLGGGLGMIGGGSYGASRGRDATESAAMKSEIRGIVQEQLAQAREQRRAAQQQRAIIDSRRQGAQIGAQRGMQLYARKLHEAMRQRQQQRQQPQQQPQYFQ
jgi:hypothetical protein